MQLSMNAEQVTAVGTLGTGFHQSGHDDGLRGTGHVKAD